MRICPTNWPALVALTTLAGCADIHAVQNAKANDADLDMTKVSTVDAVAKSRGVNVIWVHLPRKETPLGGSAGTAPAATPSPTVPDAPSMPVDSTLPADS